MFKHAIIAAGLALAASQPAFAETRVVAYGDLDLNTTEGRAQLDSRLRNAAREVCGLRALDIRSGDFEAARQCYVKSMADARKAKARAVQIELAAR
ncbi:MAG: UrcA family protein [Novosphingobium meiothermophilum]|uniref:UrcA family protein n=1 Tax=Novosphingobium TaxID=165696 RepID=UPI000D6E7C45|nr:MULTISPECIES: UrcA family protein [Novosphingobium]